MIFEFLRSLPTIVGFLLDLQKVYKEFYHWSERRKKLKELREALKDVHEKKDTTKLESIINKL